jgi:6-phosphogluconate dehydrogenase
MPGGNDYSWNALKPLLEKIAAPDFAGNPCVTHIGTDGAGHYVKMVHNGIEYALMQLMAESYDYLRKCHKLDAGQIAGIFEKLNQGKLKSFLFEIAAPVLRQKDDAGMNMGASVSAGAGASMDVRADTGATAGPAPTADYLIDLILDKAAQKGTGTWTMTDAAQRGIPADSISEAVIARSISAQKELRKNLNKIYRTKAKSSKTIPEGLVQELENALYLATVLCFAQGLDLITAAAREQNWLINPAEVCRIWQGGCIIRCELLRTLAQVYTTKPDTGHLLLADQIKPVVSANLPDLKKFCAALLKKNIPAPCFFSTLNYFLAITSKELPANLIQGLRDYFGAHGFERKDRKGTFHFDRSQV